MPYPCKELGVTFLPLAAPFPLYAEGKGLLLKLLFFNLPFVCISLKLINHLCKHIQPDNSVSRRKPSVCWFLSSCTGLSVSCESLCTSLIYVGEVLISTVTPTKRVLDPWKMSASNR